MSQRNNVASWAWRANTIGVDEARRVSYPYPVWSAATGRSRRSALGGLPHWLRYGASPRIERANAATGMYCSGG